MITRRAFVAGVGALALPAVARSEPARPLRFVTRGDPTILDPVWSTATTTRNHSLMVFDYLFGIDASLTPQPQMLQGVDVRGDGLRWELTLRDGLTWHDGERVLARDCVASIKRWAVRDVFGQALLAATDDLSAADDRKIVFRLKRPFQALPYALGKSAPSVCAMMPERLATTPADRQVKEIVGSGPFRYKADERVVGALTVYERFAGYKPREDGVPSGTAGPKRVHFDRVEWVVMPDASTAAAALQAGEVDWWDVPTVDLLPLLKGRGVTVRHLEPYGSMNLMILNHLQPPFDNPAIRRALLAAIDQSEFMTAAYGDDPSLWHVPVGYFAPGTTSFSPVGLSALEGPRDFTACAAAVKQAGYKGERVALMVPSDYQNLSALSQVAADAMQRIGLVVDYQSVDWGTVQQRRVKKDPVGSGGWSVYFTASDGIDQANPAGHISLRSSGATAWFGWPEDPKIEALRADWLLTGDPSEQHRICEALQAAAFESVPYIPVGQSLVPTAYRSDLVDLLDGSAKFWNVRRA